ncbi:unnamed protein product, partial [Oikopleura dioica]
IVPTTEEFSTIMENSTADEWLSQSTDLFSTESSIDFTFPDTSSSIMTTEFESSTENYTEESISISDSPTKLFSSTIFENNTTQELPTFESTTDYNLENSTAMMTSAAEAITEPIVYQSTDILSSLTPITENDYTAETTYPELNSTENFPNFSTNDFTTDMATDGTVTENSNSLMTTRNEVSMTTEFVTGTTENLISEESTFTSFTSNKVDSTSIGDFSTSLVTTENPNISTSSESFNTNPTVSSITVSTIGDTTAASEKTTLTMLSSKAELTTETISITSALSFSSADTSPSALTTEISAITSGALTTEVPSDASPSMVVSTTLNFSTTNDVTSQASSSTLSSLETSNSPTTNAEITTVMMTTTKTTEMTTEETTAAGSTATEAATKGTSTKASATTKATSVETTTKVSATTTTAITTTTGETTTTASKTTEEQTTTTTTTETTLPEEMDFTVDDKINLASNIWKDEYSDLESVGAKALSSDVIHDLKLILGTNGDLTEIEISVESLEEITARVGGTTVYFR